jgi:ABC-type cobalamin transport system permease subunit
MARRRSAPTFARHGSAAAGHRDRRRRRGGGIRRDRFVGLIVPHLIRPLTDRSPSAILLPSAIGGAALLTFADLGVRLIPTTNELKLGVVTAFLGCPSSSST